MFHSFSRAIRATLTSDGFKKLFYNFFLKPVPNPRGKFFLKINLLVLVKVYLAVTVFYVVNKILFKSSADTAVIFQQIFKKLARSHINAVQWRVRGVKKIAETGGGGREIK